MLLSAQDQLDLASLERAMWQESTRFDLAFQEARFASDFVEFGRSGRTYTREEIIRTDRSPINAEIKNLQVRALDMSTALVTYDSVANFNEEVEYAHRSSIWTRSQAGWQMRFHQGTPFNLNASGNERGAA